MAITKQMNIKSRTYYFYNDLIKLFDFDPNMLKLDKKKISKALIFIILDMLQKKKNTRSIV